MSRRHETQHAAVSMWMDLEVRYQGAVFLCVLTLFNLLFTRNLLLFSYICNKYIVLEYINTCLMNYKCKLL
jgi:hypothetical protein